MGTDLYCRMKPEFDPASRFTSTTANTSGDRWVPKRQRGRKDGAVDDCRNDSAFDHR
ncbi:hypothetical protein [Halostella pelagica]|uniref:hypothetical protein n=1 Tax=Halostella pelagica TaxID=2583824 RepID=UPI001386FF23|nr:hypothetical protein [Halostella pelagica]